MRPGISAVLLLIASVPLYAGSAYKWVDRDGVVHYDDKTTLNSQRLTHGYIESRDIPAQPDWAGVIPGDFVAQVALQCRNSQSRLASYENAREIYGRDPGGDVYLMSPHQARLMILETRRDVRSYCAADAAKTLWTQRQARLQAVEQAQVQKKVK
ncbi:MAG: DUF4124 domain-containing protein [Stenotrophobium sp.]